jgi:bacteriorhodopsin
LPSNDIRQEAAVALTDLRMTASATPATSAANGHTEWRGYAFGACAALIWESVTHDRSKRRHDQRREDVASVIHRFISNI